MYNQAYYKSNLDKLKTRKTPNSYFQTYREFNKDKISKAKYTFNAKPKFICDCGIEITPAGKSQHLKTKKHIKLLEQLTLFL
jgi:hypothetical protein